MSELQRQTALVEHWLDRRKRILAREADHARAKERRRRALIVLALAAAVIGCATAAVAVWAAR